MFFSLDLRLAKYRSHQKKSQWHRPIDFLFAKPDADKCMEEMRSAEVIIPAPKETEWVSPIVMVEKRYSLWRFCVNFRLNKVTKKSTHPLPRVEDTLDGLEGFSQFSSWDIKSTFWQVKVAPEDQHKTAFVVPGWGVHVYTRMPFGLTGAPSTFQALVETILQLRRGGGLGRERDRCVSRFWMTLLSHPKE